MTQSDDQNSQSGPAPQGGGDQSRDDRSGRRRGRRGRRGSGPREDGQQTPADSGSETPSSSAQQQQPRPQPVPRNPAEGAAAPASERPAPSGEDASANAEAGGERSGRNRRRGRGRGRSEGAAEGQPNPQPRPAQSGQPNSQPRPTQSGQQPASPQQDRQRPPKQNQQQRPDQQKGEKKERPPRGSVLNRRQTRGEYVDAPKQREEAPAYVPVSAATVEQYVNGHKGWQREVLATLRSIVHGVAPDIEESIMWSQPVFSANGPVCFIKAYKDYITFGFWRGTEISDSEGLLSGDLSMMRTMTIRSAKDVRRETFELMVKQAVRLNREKGDPTLS